MKNRSIASTLALLSAGVILITGCQSNKGSGTVPLSYYQGTSLDRNEIKARATTEYLEVNLNPMDSQLRLTEIAKIKNFIAAYNARGHGQLIMSVPKDAENPQLAIEAVAEAREMAWEAGVEYSQIAGSAYNARGRRGSPLVLAFKAYEAIKPDCPSLSEIDFASSSSNSDLPTLGCAVRTNMAAMIADPADLYSQRTLEDGDILRREKQLENWRDGGATAAERSDAESGAISAAVN